MSSFVMTRRSYVIKDDYMMSVQTLIDKAANFCGSEAEVARRLGTSRQALSQMKHGHRDTSPETAAILADLAHEDARDAVIQAVIERNKTGPKAEQIRAILGKGKAAGAAAMSLICLIAPTLYAMELVARELTMLHIVLSHLRRWFASAGLPTSPSGPRFAA